MPFFFSSSARTQRVMQRLFDIADLNQLDMPASYWRAPQNNPPSVFSAPALG